MSDLGKLREFEAFIRELARHASNGYLQSGCENTARALLAALDAKPEPPKPAERTMVCGECGCSREPQLFACCDAIRAERDALQARLAALEKGEPK